MKFNSVGVVTSSQNKCLLFAVAPADQMHNVNSYVRDFYFYRRNFYPQLSLVHMNPTDAAMALHSQVVLLLY